MLGWRERLSSGLAIRLAGRMREIVIAKTAPTLSGRRRILPRQACVSHAAAYGRECGSHYNTSAGLRAGNPLGGEALLPKLLPGAGSLGIDSRLCTGLRSRQVFHAECGLS